MDVSAVAARRAIGDRARNEQRLAFNPVPPFAYQATLKAVAGSCYLPVGSAMPSFLHSPPLQEPGAQLEHQAAGKLVARFIQIEGKGV